MHTFENENANEFENEKCILKMNTNFDVVFEVMCYMKIRTEKTCSCKTLETKQAVFGQTAEVTDNRIIQKLLCGEWRVSLVLISLDSEFTVDTSEK